MALSHGPGRSESQIYHLQLPANTRNLDLAKGRKIVTNVSPAKSFQPPPLSDLKYIILIKL